MALWLRHPIETKVKDRHFLNHHHKTSLELSCSFLVLVLSFFVPVLSLCCPCLVPVLSLPRLCLVLNLLPLPPWNLELNPGLVCPYCQRGGGEQWTIFYVPIPLVPFRVGGERVNENGPMSPSEQFSFWRHSLAPNKLGVILSTSSNQIKQNLANDELFQAHIFSRWWNHMDMSDWRRIMDQFSSWISSCALPCFPWPSMWILSDLWSTSYSM